MAKKEKEKAARKKTCVDDLPSDVKPIIIGAIDLCGRVSTYVAYAMRDDVSDKQVAEKAYDVHVSACKLNQYLRRVFTWEDISKILEDLRADYEKKETDISIKEGEVNG